MSHFVLREFRTSKTEIGCVSLESTASRHRGEVVIQLQSHFNFQPGKTFYFKRVDSDARKSYSHLELGVWYYATDFAALRDGQFAIRKYTSHGEDLSPWWWTPTARIAFVVAFIGAISTFGVAYFQGRDKPESHTQMQVNVPHDNAVVRDILLPAVEGTVTNPPVASFIVVGHREFAETAIAMHVDAFTPTDTRFILGPVTLGTATHGPGKNFYIYVCLLTKEEFEKIDMRRPDRTLAQMPISVITKTVVVRRAP